MASKTPLPERLRLLNCSLNESNMNNLINPQLNLNLKNKKEIVTNDQIECENINKSTARDRKRRALENKYKIKVKRLVK